MYTYWVIPHDGTLTSKHRVKKSGQRMFITSILKIGPFGSYASAAEYAVERDFDRVDIICEEAP